MLWAPIKAFGGRIGVLHVAYVSPAVAPSDSRDAAKIRANVHPMMVSLTPICFMPAASSASACRCDRLATNSPLQCALVYFIVCPLTSARVQGVTWKLLRMGDYCSARLVSPTMPVSGARVVKFSRCTRSAKECIELIDAHTQWLSEGLLIL